MGLLDLMRHDIHTELQAMRRYALVLTRSADQAEDLVQEALTRAIASAHAWRPDGQLRRWLLAIVHNTYLKRHQRQKIERAAAEEASWAHDRTLPPPQAARVELARTMAALMELPEEQRTVLVLVAFEGLNYRDAAEILSIPLGTLMSRLARGREALRTATGRDTPRKIRSMLQVVR